MTAVEFAALALATWRVASLLAEEDGPFGVLGRLRHAAGVRYDDHSWPVAQNELAAQITCMWCLSPWVGLAWAAFWLLWPRAAFVAALPFAFSAVALVAHGRGIRFRKRSD